VRESSAFPQAHDSSSPLQVRARSKRAIFAFVVLAFVWAWGLGFAATRAKAHSPVLNVALMVGGIDSDPERPTSIAWQIVGSEDRSLNRSSPRILVEAR
jgi:hypothetical protein